MFDVIVVGAGSAGATAAYFLGEAGCRVLVLEKQTLPRYKACGGGLSLAFLKSQFPFSFEPVIETHVRQMNYRFLGLTVSVPCEQGIMAMVMRDRFDAHILSYARCELHQDARVCQVTENRDSVTVDTADGKSFTARYLIGADGAGSIVARSVGLHRKRTLIPALEAEVNVPKAVMDFYAGGPTFIFDGPRLGYSWIFPKANCLSVGTAMIRPRKNVLKKTLFRVMNKMGISLEDVVLHGHPIPLYSSRAPLATARTLLVGDAAGLVDPFSGEGIRPAIKSGRLAAEAIQSGHPERYARSVHQQIGNQYLIGTLVSYFFYLLRELCLLFGTPNPFATQAILNIISDKGSSLELMLIAILTLPYFLPVEITADLIGLIAGAERENRFRAVVYPPGYY